MIIAINAQVVELRASRVETNDGPIEVHEVIVKYGNCPVDGKDWHFAQGSLAKYQVSKEEFERLSLGDGVTTTLRLGEL